MLDKITFIDELTKKFPEIREEILDEDYSFSISLQLGCFKRYTQEAIDKNDVHIIKECFEFIGSHLNNITSDVENSVYISYLNHLDFSHNKKAKKLLPEKMIEAIDNLESYNLNNKSEKVRRFLNDIE